MDITLVRTWLGHNNHGCNVHCQLIMIVMMGFIIIIINMTLLLSIDIVMTLPLVSIINKTSVVIDDGHDESQDDEYMWSSLKGYNKRIDSKRNDMKLNL